MLELRPEATTRPIGHAAVRAWLTVSGSPDGPAASKKLSSASVVKILTVSYLTAVVCGRIDAVRSVRGLASDEGHKHRLSGRADGPFSQRASRKPGCIRA